MGLTVTVQRSLQQSVLYTVQLLPGDGADSDSATVSPAVRTLHSTTTAR